MGLVGYLVWRERGGRIRYFEEELYHVPLWRVELPKNNHPDRTIQRALTTLRRHGVTRLLTDDAPLLPPVATGPLWRALAGHLPWASLRGAACQAGGSLGGSLLHGAGAGGAWAGVGDTGLRGVGLELAAAVRAAYFGAGWGFNIEFH